MSQREPIDYLLSFLEKETNDGGDSQQNLSQAEGSSEAAGDNSCNDRDVPASPVLLPRHVKFLSSSSLKKRLKKTTNCRFCVRFQFNRDQVETHLKQSELCFNLYARQFRVHSLDSVLVKLYKCMGCSSTGNFQLKREAFK